MKNYLRFLALAGLVGAMPLASTADELAKPDQPIWLRHYQDGEKIVYHLKGLTRGRQSTNVYEIEADGVVKQDAGGKFYEEFAWTNLIWNKRAMKLPPTSASFRQELALPPDFKLSLPDLSHLAAILNRPITDLLTFYTDMLVAAPAGIHAKAGDHVYFERGAPTSWADDIYVKLGEDSIDYDCTIAEIDQMNHTATIVMKHESPKNPQIKLPAEWMRAPVADTPNNWVNVKKTSDGKFIAAVGQETLEVKIKVSLTDGRILSGHIDSLMELRERECSDESLTKGGDPIRYQIKREVDLD